MNQVNRIKPLLFRSIVLAVALFFSIGPTVTQGAWGPLTPISEIVGGCCDGQVVVVEGQVTELTTGVPEAWNIYDFTDGTDTTLVNFEDNLPESAIIRNTTVRIMGIVNQKEPGDWFGFTDIAVTGVETQGTVPLQATATAAAVNSGSLVGQFVVLEGQLLNQLDPEFPVQWNVYKFTDTTGTTSIDLENQLQPSDFPTEPIILSGTVDNSIPPKVNDPTMFVGAGTPVDQFNLTVNKAGDGAGTVTSAQPGIDCGSSCTTPFNNGATVTLTATPDFGSEFTGWSGCDQTQANECTVTMTAAETVTATFTKGGGSDDGWVWGPVTPLSEIEDGRCCDEQVVVIEGQVVQSSALPEEWKIYEFSDGITFTLVNFEDNLPDSAIIRNTTVRILGVVNQGGGPRLTEVNVSGVQTQGNVPLQATATAAAVNSGSLNDQFVVLEGQLLNQLDPEFPVQWNVYKFEDTTGTTSIDLENQLQPIDFPRETILVSGTVEDWNPPKVNDPTMFVGAGTPVEQFSLTVGKAGDGAGTVTSIQPGIDCGSSCTAPFDKGTSVTLTATPDFGSGFTGWSDCNQTQANKCTLELTQSKLVTARFTKKGAEDFSPIMLLLLGD